MSVHLRSAWCCAVPAWSACSSVAAAYQDEIFCDGFESGYATAWSFATEVCDNGIDDDGWVDCDYWDCQGVPPCGPLEAGSGARSRP